jgi:hypothetical protein
MAVGLLLIPALVAGQQTVEQWNFIEVAQNGPVDSPTFNPFVEVTFSATFEQSSGGITATSITVPGFYDGAGLYIVRFAPSLQGPWNYTTASNSPQLPPQVGSFVCVKPGAANHGPVVVDAANPLAFAYADGTNHFSVGSTSYAWVHLNPANANATLATLRAAPFNKLRMTVFPKYYPWTHVEPAPTDFFAFPRVQPPPPPCYECCPDYAGTFDLTRFHPPFWRAFEGYVQALGGMGVQVRAAVRDRHWHALRVVVVCL